MPLALRVVSTERLTGATVRTVSFAVDRSTRLGAYLVTPAAAGPHPGIVFAPGRRATKDVFLAEAVADARRGVVSLSLDDLSAGYPSFTAADRPLLVRRVVALRRALDLLLAQPGVDPARIGFVGHSDGAELGGILAGADRRAAAYVLMSGGGTWDRSGSPAYDRLIAPLDADGYVPHAAPAALLYQNAFQDPFNALASMRRYQRLGSRPKLVRWYDAGHSLDPQAERDRQAWLARRLRLTAP